jgi:hypothetical protein
MLECGELMTKFMGEDTFDGFSAFGEKCLQLDPVSLTIALDETVCVVCGDSLVTGAPYGDETCDAGAFCFMPCVGA